MPTMRTTKDAAIAHVDGDYGAMPRRVKGLAALRAAVVALGEYPAGDQRDSGDKNDSRNGDHVPRYLIAMRKPMHFARGQRE